MTFITRPRKVEVIVLGRGLAAAACAKQLVEQGRRVAWLVEQPGWETGWRPAWLGWHLANPERLQLAKKGAQELAMWQADGLPGISSHIIEESQYPLWLLNYEELLPALGERIAAGTTCWVANGTYIRGISVIESAILGAIAEDARYDARELINAAEGKRYAAFARMMRRPHTLQLTLFTPTAAPNSIPPINVTADGNATYPNARPFERDAHAPTAEETTVKGATRIYGVAGWPLLTLGLIANNFI